MRNNWSGQTFAHPERRRPWVGDMFSMDINRPMQHIMRHHRGLGPLFELRVFGQKFVFVTDAELAHELNDEGRFEKALSPALVALRDFAGDGLFTAYNDEASWYHAHTLLMPAFSKQAMQSYHPVMLQAATELFSYWDARPGPIDVSSDMTKLTMETIGRAAFSQDFGSFTRPDPHPFVDAMVAALKAGREKGSLETMPGSKLLLRRLDRRNAPRLAYVERFLDGIIAARRANGEESTGDLLGIMLDDDIGDVNIRHQILTFLVAGHETTSGALSFALYYLSRDPEVLRRAQEETDAVLGPDRDVLPTYEQVARFRYLRKVLDEGLRLWPTAPAYARKPRETTRLAGRFTMTPDDWAMVLLPLVHRDPAVWGPTAEEFDPDRARPKEAGTVKPFGTGERACIGRQFALHEAVLVLARMLHRYDVAPDPSYRLTISERLTLMPEGFTLTLTPRRAREGPDAGLLSAR